MQQYPNNLSADDRRIARRWTLASVGFYGSALVGLILYAVFFNERPAANLAADDAAAKASAANAPREPAYKAFAKMTQPRLCNQSSC